MKIDNKTIEKLLVGISKPARYIGREINSVSRDFKSSKLRVVLCYPDVYDIGMSNYGMKIIYEMLNNLDEVMCDRVFSPWIDMEESLRTHQVPLYALESKHELSDFDIIGFTLQYELVYTNVLNVMELSGIPLYSKDRTEEHPIIIAGGPSVYNPVPMKDFIDIFVIGEGEYLSVEIINVVKEMKSFGRSRTSIIEELATIDNLYVAAAVKNGDEQSVKRYIQPSIKDLYIPKKPVLPYINIVQDKGIVEVSRGCSAGCRFCLASFIYRPVRERNVDEIIEAIDEILSNTGYTEFTLLSLNVANYSQLSVLLDILNQRFGDRKISFSLPSLRLDQFTVELLDRIKSVRKSGLTFAIEAGSDNLRKAINKGELEKRFFEIVDRVVDKGWNHIKLYFMIGFSFYERDSYREEDDIIDLIRRVIKHNRKLKLNINIGIFVPKPHTPFQRKAQLSIEEGRKRLSYIKNSISNKRVKISYSNPEMSFLEGILSKGDQNIGKIIYDAFRSGCKFDGWDDRLLYDKWMEAIRTNNIDVEKMIAEPITEEAILHWDIIDTGVDIDFLKRELKKSEECELTEDCLDKCYDNCGICKQLMRKDKAEQIDIKSYTINEKRKRSDQIVILRAVFRKVGFLKYISHLELINTIKHVLLRLDVDLVFSEGYNPSPRIAFGFPLPVGIESEYELFEFKAYEPVDERSLQNEINSILPDELAIKELNIIRSPCKSIQQSIKFQTYSINLKNEDFVLVKDRITDILTRKVTDYTINGKKRDLQFDEMYYDKHSEKLIIIIKLCDGSAGISHYLEYIFQKPKEKVIDNHRTVRTYQRID